MNLLHIDSSALGEHSISRTLTQAIVTRFRAQSPAIHVAYLDLDADPLPHLTAQSLANSDAEQTARSERVLADFLASDVLVIGAPMYNFSIPSTLKAWLDRIAIAGKTFRYTADGPEGLAKGKRVIVVSSQGGVHEPGGASDFQESYLRFVFGFLGVTDVEVIRAQGVNLSPEHRQRALATALDALPEPYRLADAA